MLGPYNSEWLLNLPPPLFGAKILLISFYLWNTGLVTGMGTLPPTPLTPSKYQLEVFCQA